MKTEAILFDLDGTLLPMDQEVFIKAYFGALAKKLAPLGYDPQTLIKNVWAGTVAMIKNDGSKTNEKAFWDLFVSFYGKGVLEHLPYFDDFYKNEFHTAKQVCSPNARIPVLISSLKARGFRLALATNPIFPAAATEARIAWAGLDKNDFEVITTYENIGFCKPNPAYYAKVVSCLGLEPEQCVMIGNDVSDDLPAATLGMKVFILTDCLINHKDIDFSSCPHGGLDALEAFLFSLNS